MDTIFSNNNNLPTYIATTISAFGLGYYFLSQKINEKKKTKNEKNLYEIHVLIDPTKPEFRQKLQEWHVINKDKLLKIGFLNSRIMATRTSVGVAKIQSMITCVVYVKNHAESIQKTKELSSIVRKALSSESEVVREKVEEVVREKVEEVVHEEVVREKVEEVVHEEVVREKVEEVVREKVEEVVREKVEKVVHEEVVREKVEEVVREKVEEVVVQEKSEKVQQVHDTCYIESHCKVIGINTVDEWRKLAKLCASSSWTNKKIAVPLLSNFDSMKGPYPVTTLRMYETDIDSFLIEHYKFINFLKESGYKITNPHIEISPYDNNPFTDLDWAIFSRYPGAFRDYVLGKSFNQCFRWCEPEDFTDEAYNPPDGWLEKVIEFEKSQ
jgi:hypothetical protein